MTVTKIKVSPEVKLYRRAWRLFDSGLIDKNGLIKMLEKIDCK